MENFERTNVPKPRRSNVNLNAVNCTTLDFMRLQPVYCQEMIPGDTFEVKCSGFVRLAPLAAPVFGRARIDYHAFFVPNRILWKDWNQYIAGNNDNTVPTIDLFSSEGITSKWKGNTLQNDTILKHDTRAVLTGLGYPLNAGSDILDAAGVTSLNALPIRAYQRIWWDWFRNSEKINDANEATYIRTEAGNVYTANNFGACVAAKYRTFDKDYFTSALNAPVATIKANKLATKDFTGTTTRGAGVAKVNPTDYGTIGNAEIKGLYTTTSQSVSIQAIRFANSLQRWLETNNVAGSRLMGRLLAHFGVAPTAERLDMAEFIGYTSQNVTISDVTTNNQQVGTITTENAFGINSQGIGLPTGTLKGSETGKGWSSANGSFRYSSDEHGFFIIIASVVPSAVYENIVPRSLLRGIGYLGNGRFDWFTQEMENNGYQPMLAIECGVPNAKQADAFTAAGEDYQPLQVWGYQPRYEEYRHALSYLSGDFADAKTYATMRNYVLSRNLLEATGTVNVDTDEVDMQNYQVEYGYQFTEQDKATYDANFSITNTLYDHFTCEFSVQNSASRPISGNDVPSLEGDNNGYNTIPNGGVSL